VDVKIVLIFRYRGRERGKGKVEISACSPPDVLESFINRLERRGEKKKEKMETLLPFHSAGNKRTWREKREEEKKGEKKKKFLIEQRKEKRPFFYFSPILSLYPVRAVEKPPIPQIRKEKEPLLSPGAFLGALAIRQRKPEKKKKRVATRQRS